MTRKQEKVKRLSIYCCCWRSNSVRKRWKKIRTKFRRKVYRKILSTRWRRWRFISVNRQRRIESRLTKINSPRQGIYLRSNRRRRTFEINRRDERKRFFNVSNSFLLERKIFRKRTTNRKSSRTSTFTEIYVVVLPFAEVFASRNSNKTTGSTKQNSFSSRLISLNQLSDRQKLFSSTKSKNR